MPPLRLPLRRHWALDFGFRLLEFGLGWALWALGFGVWVWDLGLGAVGLGIWGLGFGLWGLGFVTIRPMQRGVRIVLTLIGVATVISVAGVSLLYLLLARGPSVPQSGTLVLRPGGDLQDVLPDDVVGQLLGRD